MYRRYSQSRFIIKRSVYCCCCCCYCSVVAFWTRTCNCSSSSSSIISRSCSTAAFASSSTLRQQHLHRSSSSSSLSLLLDNNNNNNHRLLIGSSNSRFAVARTSLHPTFSSRLMSSSSPSSDQQQQQTTTTAGVVVVDVAANLQNVRDRIQQACAKRDQQQQQQPVRLVAVSKTKPIEMIQAAYHAGCRVFGENYVQELVSKVQELKMLTAAAAADTHSSDYSDIQWHYIGPLQSNKVNTLLKPFLQPHEAAEEEANNRKNILSIDQLTIETVASSKLATKLNNAIEKAGVAAAAASNQQQLLRVFVQVNTSGEDTKSGVEPGQECIDLCLHIVQQCPHLKLCGLMTIGAPGDTTCFTILKQCQSQVMEALSEMTAAAAAGGGAVPEMLELSMGMSDDFEQAIAAGATNVRVGSTIFGARDYSNKK